MSGSVGIYTAVALQAAVLIFLAFKLGRSLLGKLGFLLMGATFFYHGFTEIIQGLFPDNNLYRSMTDDASVASFTQLVAAGMFVFTFTYLMTLNRRSSGVRLQVLIDRLKKAYLLDGTVLLAMSLPTFVVVLLRVTQIEGYWVPGLAEQFTVYMLVIALVTLCIKLKGRGFFGWLLGFSLIIITAGSRTFVAWAVVTTLATLVRYGIRLPLRWIAFTGVCLVAALLIVSSSRGAYGRFSPEQGFLERLKIFSETINTQQNLTGDSDAVLADTVYRFDGNSYGAIILEKQSQGYGVTGLTQLGWTMAIMTPSFIYQGKRDLGDYRLNEQSYTSNFYSLEDINFVSDLWSLLLGYFGPVALIAIFAVSGWLVAALDNWLGRTGTVSAYLIGIAATLIAVNIEEGVGGVIYTIRGFIVFIFAAMLLKRVSLRKRRPISLNTAGPPVPQNP